MFTHPSLATHLTGPWPFLLSLCPCSSPSLKMSFPSPPIHCLSFLLEPTKCTMLQWNHYRQLYFLPLSIVALVVKNPPANTRDKRHGLDPWVRKILWGRAKQPTPVFLQGESHGWRSLVGCSPCGYRVGHDWNNLSSVQFSSLQSLSHVWLFVTPWIAARQASLSITNSQSSPKLMSIALVMPSSHIILCRPLLLLPSVFPSVRIFSESAVHIRWQSTGVSALASVPPKNTQDWSPLGWTGWISLQSKGLSRVFSNSTVQKHQFFCTQLSL